MSCLEPCSAREASSASSAASARLAASTAACALSSSVDDSRELRREHALLLLGGVDLGLERGDPRIDGGLLVSRGSGADAGPAMREDESKPEHERSDRRRIRLLSLHVDGRPSPQRSGGPRDRVALDGSQGSRHVSAERSDLGTVVLVGDRAGAVLELELLERGERAIALLEQLEPSPLVLVEVVERVGLRLGLS